MEQRAHETKPTHKSIETYMTDQWEIDEPFLTGF